MDIKVPKILENSFTNQSDSNSDNKDSNTNNYFVNISIEKRKKELKDRRTQILFKKSTYSKIKKVAKIHSISVNDLVNQVMDNFCNQFEIK